MTRFKLLTCSIVSALFLHGCSPILESVLLSDGAQDAKTLSVQEDFKINIQTLTFKNALQANNDPYPRRLMLNGIGSKANVFDEADFLNSDIPSSSQDVNYLLGIGDILSFRQLNKFVKPKIRFPTQAIETDYLVGVGDELTLIQLNEVNKGLSKIISDGNDENNRIVGNPQPSETILKTSSHVGTNGNILLLGLGSIKAKNRSLNDIQTEVRNILIRNGLAPSFQLEITGFNSKKAFVTFPNANNTFGNNTVTITNLPISLKELVINYGMRPSSRETAIVTLTREGQRFPMTADQIFDKSSPRIVVKDKDQIEIEKAAIAPAVSEVVVGTNGNILLPGIGNLKAEKRSLPEIQADITSILLEKGMTPSFQLEIVEFKSKKFFFISHKQSSKVIPLTNSKLTLKEAVLSSGNSGSDITQINKNDLTIVSLTRNGSSHHITYQEMLIGVGSKVLIQNGDTVELKSFNYKPGQVFALAGSGNAQIINIDPSKRETLADILFTPKGALNQINAKRSEVYLLRGRNPSVAYHLDAQNVSRILVAAKTELRPNDIVYVAERPIISFSRTLAELTPLRILLRDIQDSNIP